ncbi:MAG: hypothetical protein LBN27_12755 [Prevotellaceae bacterium]|jgi:hypothetical protein|nr:hypothetical protein [Prevotellaceae bacterium]
MEATAMKTTKANVIDSMVNAPVRKSKIAEFWEKYPNGCGEILDYRAVLK